MTSHIREQVAESLDGQRVDRIVAIITDLSRSEVSELIAQGNVLVDGDPPAKPSLKLSCGQLVEIRIPESNTELLADDSVQLDVVHADEHVIVVNKQAGLIVHPGAGVESGTLVQGLVSAFSELSEIGEPDRPGIVHRLDKGTSGLLVVARSELAYESLSEQLRSHAMERRYITLVWGLIETTDGVIDAPIGRSNRQPMRRAVVSDGKPARTSYQVLQRFEDQELTLLACALETGRTHQIRVHLEAIGHPIVGDDRYGRGGGGVRDTFGLLRPFLHAQTLGFRHPGTGQIVRFSSDLPEDLLRVLTSVGGEVPQPGSAGAA